MQSNKFVNTWILLKRKGRKKNWQLLYGKVIVQIVTNKNNNLISGNEKVQTNKQTILFHNVKIHLKIDQLIFYIYQFNVQSMLANQGVQ